MPRHLNGGQKKENVKKDGRYARKDNTNIPRY